MVTFENGENRWIQFQILNNNHDIQFKKKIKHYLNSTDEYV